MKIKGGGTGQGALEYLIIVAAVLAIAAIVVLFLTGAFQSTSSDIGACKAQAASCATSLLGTPDGTLCGVGACDKCSEEGMVSVCLPNYPLVLDACVAGRADCITAA